MLSLIPAPKSYSLADGYFIIDDNQKVKSDFDLPLLKAEISDDANFVIIKDDSVEQEGYKLAVTTDSITIKASSKIGAYYALQTIRKLAKTDLGGNQVPCCQIDDSPRFAWRGINIDEVRHFFGMDAIKKYLDLMFLEKLNVLHWHLTDDQGWRIEIKKYPRLTEIGSVRKYTQLNGWKCLQIEEKEYSGFYTQEQIKEIVAYAKERGIMIVPEIDFPAHSAAAIASYNNLACRELDREVQGFFGGDYPVRKLHMYDWNRTLCIGKQSTFDFVYGVIDEVCQLFDAPYIHMGGDEAPQNEWKKCPHCQKVIKDNNLKNESELQAWFTNKLTDYLATKGKSLIGWNEVLQGKNLDRNTVIQYWTPKRDKKAEAYVNSGGKMILSNHQAFYFDMTYGQYPLTNTYNFTPEKYGVNSQNVKNVLGLEGELWTEWIRDTKRLELCMCPRLQALSEVAWSSKPKDWKDFKARLDDYKPTLEALNINYAVDKVSLVKNPFKRKKILSKFFNGDTELETRLNDEYKSKGEK